MNFTTSQKNAISLRDCSLIVSAGAGSGKTAVLTERILERICDENDECNINDFLIVTFTKAAAKELSDRIRKKLSERAAAFPDNKKIIRNIALMPLAKIMTINAFCYELVRENFQKMGLSASVRIADEAEVEVIRQKIMNEVVDGYFEEHGDDESFIATYEVFASSKNDKGFVDTLLALDTKLSNVTDREGFCRSVTEGYREVSEGKKFFETAFGASVRESIRESAKETVETMKKLMDACTPYDILMDKYYGVLESEYEFAREVYHACDREYSYLRSIVMSHKVATFAGKVVPKTFENQSLKEAISASKKAVADEFVKNVKELCCCGEELLRTAAQDSGMIIGKLFEMVNEFRERMDERKRELSILEFSDAERFTLNLLVKSFSPFEVTDFAVTLRESYKEIYIDEYQDVNPLQDMIFRAISKTDEGGEFNRFMVGDIKQSIYRFRGARSEIFMSYRDSFCDIEKDGNAKRIFMSDNFRCSKSVIGLTNIIFERLMGKYYGDGDRLNFGRVENRSIDGKVKLIGFGYDSDVAEGVSSPELEAALLCNKIKQIVNNPEHTDSDGRMYKYSDIGILARNKASLKVFESVLNACGIPSSCSFGESFYGKKEILLCLNILSSIDNPERDIFLAGFMRSFAGGFTDDELAIIKKKYKDMSLYRAVINFGENEKETYFDLSLKCSSFVKTLRFYRNFSRGKSADKLLWKLYTDMDIPGFCSSDSFTDDKKGTRKNLLKLYQMARDFSKTSFRGVGAFIDYINGSMENSDVKSEREIMGDCVSLMTIHSSKGLEFPVCFVANLSKKFDKRDERERLVFSENAGLAVKLCDTGAIRSTESSSGLISIDTPFRKFVAKEIDRELLEEEVRILYVAMTRARDMLIMTGAFPKKIENAMKDVQSSGLVGNAGECNNYFSMILSCLANESAVSGYFNGAGMNVLPTEYEAEKYLECSYLSCEDIKALYDSEIVQEQAEVCTQDETEIDDELLEELRKVGSFTYDYVDIPAKITVSRLKKGLIDEQEETELSKDEASYEEKEELQPRFVSGETTADGAEKGTALHLFMQFAHYDKCEDGCEKEADRLLSMGFIDERQRGLLDISKLDRFFSSPFYSKIKKGKKIYREQRFNLDLASFEGEYVGDVLVQGVIDLFFENEDGTYTVVDFKTDACFGEGAEQLLIRRHRQQLLYYKRAVEEMTEGVVKDALIYSFSLMREISVL
ncbi:MAG: UvrD-helicase domain-containing protein [Clostridia bacterium]|nr:UvrD-helicase domain-containing protein [Clostridia bacterium]